MQCLVCKNIILNKGFLPQGKPWTRDSLCSPLSAASCGVLNPVLSALARKFKNSVFDFTRSLNNKAKVIFIGNTDETELSQKIAKLMKNEPIIATGKLSLRQLLSLLKKTHLFIGLDSGPSQMAIVMGAKVIDILGPAGPEDVIIYSRKQHIIVTKQENFPCFPCLQTVCQRPNDRCMMAITVDDVWQAVETHLKSLKINQQYGS